MINVSSAGKNLHVIINCKYIPCHHWMSFAAWYSISKNLPESTIEVFVERSYPKWDLFHWIHKINIPLTYGQELSDEKIKNLENKINKKIVVVPFCAMAVRPYEDNSIIEDVRSNNFSTFVTYLDGCAGFHTSEWIHSLRAPFYGAAKRFQFLDSTPDEIKVLKLWERMHPLFSSI